MHDFYHYSCSILNDCLILKLFLILCYVCHVAFDVVAAFCVAFMFFHNKHEFRDSTKAIMLH